MAVTISGSSGITLPDSTVLSTTSTPEAIGSWRFNGDMGHANFVIKSNYGNVVSQVSASGVGASGYCGRFTAPVAGYYMFSLTVTSAFPSASQLLISLYGYYQDAQNVTSLGREIIDLRSDNIQESMTFAQVFYLNGGEYLEPDIYRGASGYEDPAAEIHTSVMLIKEA
jgi:hypothetical protein